jgi:4-cresol dehydrogenase (hydroxylating)
MPNSAVSPNLRIEKALLEWIALLGKKNVLTASGECSRIATATFQTEQFVPAVLRPKHRNQVKECLLIANKYRIPLYPFSSGRNWGFGSKVPVTGGNVLLDLGQMNSILKFNEDDAYIVIEPGVSFYDIHLFLTSKKSALYMPMGGGPKEGSVIGNTLERGEGTGAYGDRVDQVTGMEVILPTGEIIHLGHGAFVGSKTQNISLRTPGPEVSGLFTQSNLGIVTSMAVALPTLPETLAVISGSIQSNESLASAIDACCKLTRKGVLSPYSSFLWSGHKIRSVIETSSKNKRSTPLELNHQSAWYLSCLQAEASSAHASVTRTMLTNEFISLLDALQIPSEENCRKRVMSLGDPSYNNANSVYYSMSIPVPEKLNPDLDGCGVRWITAILPFQGDAVVAITKQLKKIFIKHEMPFNVAITNASDRRLHLFVAILYDRTIGGRDDIAEECEKELRAFLIQEGCLPYRLGIQSMASMPDQKGNLKGFLSKLKELCDPNSILAPGRYI